MAKKRTDEVETQVPVNPFEVDMSQVGQEFSFEGILESYKTKLGESDKRKIGINDRIKKNLESIARIQNLIEQLNLKAHQESGTVWVSQVVRPISAQIGKVFPNATVEVTPMAGSAIISIAKKGIRPDEKMRGLDCKSLTLVQHEQGVGIRDFSRDTGDYPAGSLGALAGLNHPIVPVPADRVIETLVEWILK